MTTQLIDQIPKKDPNWRGLTPFEAAKQLTPKKREAGLRCCAALRQILSGDKKPLDYEQTVLGVQS
ncbi:hypothetical protein AAOGI_06890 [Agarivorans albus]